MQQYRVKTSGAMARMAASMFTLGAAALLCGAAVPAADAPTRADQVLFSGADGDVGALQAALPHLADPIVATLARLEIAAARLDEVAVRREIAAYDALHDHDPARLALAASVDAGAAFARGDYARAEQASRAWLALLDRGDPHNHRQDAAQVHAVAALLARAPAISVTGKGQRIATTRDAADLLRGDVVINGVAQQAVLDTGANLPVVSASLAKKLHLRMIDGDASVGSSSRNAVATRIGVADRMRFAGFTFRNVPFLVLDDSQLALPVGGGYRIDAIIGFPVFRAIGSVTFSDGFLAPRPALLAGPRNLTAAGNDLFVTVGIGRFSAPLHLDTGAKASNLSAIFAERHPEALRGLERSSSRSAGAGGATTQTVAHWRNAPITLAGARTTLADLPIVTTGSDDVSDSTMGTLGQDVLKRFAAYTVDFDTMRFAVRDAPGARAKQPPAR